jgi:hypothetical protein
VLVLVHTVVDKSFVLHKQQNNFEIVQGSILNSEFLSSFPTSQQTQNIPRFFLY